MNYLTLVLGSTFLLLAVASGLYYLTELIEEYTVLSKRIITHLITVHTTP